MTSRSLRRHRYTRRRESRSSVQGSRLVADAEDRAGPDGRVPRGREV